VTKIVIPGSGLEFRQLISMIKVRTPIRVVYRENPTTYIPII
jgi:hypothetical protein